MQRTVIVIIGATASGKSRLALDVARRLQGEIVSIDSMTVYRGMDIGTAKPSIAEREAVPHHLIDVADPWEPFSVKRFLDLADAAVDDIHARGKPAIAVGGTMLYFKAFRMGLFDGPASDPDYRATLRARASSEGVAVLHRELAAVDPVSAQRIHPNDLKRIERALEVHHQTGRPISELQQEWARTEPRQPTWRWLLLGVSAPRHVNSRRINERVRRMIAAGLVDEARRLYDDPRGVGDQASQAVGYRELFEHFAGACPLDYAIEQIKIHSRRLAKHQRTWMRRLDDVQWIEREAGMKPPELINVAWPMITAAGMAPPSKVERVEPTNGGYTPPDDA